MQCPSCSQEVSPNDKFCTHCGKPITAPPTDTSSPSPLTSNEYIIEQKLAALRDTFGLKDRNGNLLAYVKKKIVSWGPQFSFETPDGHRFGEMRGKVLAVRPTFEIYDMQSLVGVVKKKVLKLLGSEWWLEDRSGTEMARIKGNITEHDFTIQSPTGSTVAQVHKKWVSIRDSYGVEILTKDLTPYIIIAYVIAMDHAEWKRGRNLGMLGVGTIGAGTMIDDFGNI